MDARRAPFLTSAAAAAAIGVAAALLGGVAAQPAAAAPALQRGLYPAPKPVGGLSRAQGAKCPAPPPPLGALRVGAPHRLGDRTFSQVDPERLRRVNESVQPLRTFGGGVVTRANAYAASGGKDVAAARCALDWLDQWAAAGALQQMQSHDAVFHRSIQLAGFAQAYLQVRPALADAGERRRIDQWFGALARDTVEHYDGLAPTSTVRNNNHRYWAGFAVASVAVITGDQRLWDWGLESYRVGVCSVDDVGALPLELRRGEAARGYHVYALGPLLATAELAARNGVAVYEVCGGKLHRLVRFVMDSIDKPATMERLAKTRQGPFFRDDGTIRAKNAIAGMEFYERRFPNRTPFSARFRQQRPYAATELGGAVTRQLDLAR